MSLCEPMKKAVFPVSHRVQRNEGRETCVACGDDLTPTSAALQGKSQTPANSTSAERESCYPCAGTGKRHSIFDDCNCEPECMNLGVCGECQGTGKKAYSVVEQQKALIEALENEVKQTVIASGAVANKTPDASAGGAVNAEDRKSSPFGQGEGDSHRLTVRP